MHSLTSALNDSYFMPAFFSGRKNRRYFLGTRVGGFQTLCFRSAEG